METHAFPDWLIELLGVIRTRPGAYLGSPEIRIFMAFVDGFETARVYAGAPARRPSFEEFGRWVCEKYVYAEAGGFVRALELTFQARPDQWRSELHLLLEELDAFVASRGESLPPAPELAAKFFGTPFDDEAGGP